MARNEDNSRFDLRSSLWQLKDDFTDVSLICSKTKETLRGHKIILAGDILTIANHPDYYYGKVENYNCLFFTIHIFLKEINK